MTRRVERLQWGLAGGTVLLLLLVMGALGYSRWRAARGWLGQVQRRSGVSIERETDGFTYSQSLQGRTVFTLHASKAFQHADGLYTLHDVILTLYGLKGDRADRIYGNDFEWDETKGIARANGEVQMDLQVPEAAAMAARGQSRPEQWNAAADPETIHVRTSGVVFLRKLDVAATEQQIEFHYGDLTCIARGAEFDSNPSAVHLLADVQMNGTLQGEPVQMTALKADFDRTSNQVALDTPVVNWGDRNGRASNALLRLRSGGSLESAVATGKVQLGQGTRNIMGARLDVELNERNRPLAARMSGGVRLSDTDRNQPGQGQAAEMRVRFDAEGRAQDVAAVGNAMLLQRERTPKGEWLEREAKGEQVTAMLAAAGAHASPQLRRLHASGAAEAHADSANKNPTGTGTLRTQVAADDLVADFASAADRRPVISALHGRGQAVLRQSSPTGVDRVSRGDLLDVTFSESGADKAARLEVSSAVEQGHVSIRDIKPARSGVTSPEVTTGSADRAEFDATSQRLTLSGNAHAGDGATSLAANSIVLHQDSGDAEAAGNVTGTLAGTGSSATPTHVAAQRSLLVNATHLATFEGSATAPARLWQGASQVEAATISVDNVRHTLTARPAAAGGYVHSVFAGESSKSGAAARAAGGNLLRVESRALDYSETQHTARFSGPVRMDVAAGQVSGSDALAIFQPAGSAVAKPLATVTLPANSLDRVVVSGNVKLQQETRQGSGEQLVYKAADGSFTLTGTPGALPRVTDPQQGIVTGASLMFRAGDNTIVVAGAGNARARIDTHVRR